MKIFGTKISPRTLMVCLACLTLVVLPFWVVKRNSLADIGSADSIDLGEFQPRNVLKQVQGDTPKHSEDEGMEEFSARLATLHEKSLGMDYEGELRWLAAKYVEFDPDQGLKWLLSLENTPYNVPAFATFGAHLAKHDFEKALTSLSLINSKSLKRAFLYSALASRSSENFSEAWDAASHHKDLFDGVPDAYTTVIRRCSGDSLPQAWQNISTIGENSGTKSSWCDAYVWASAKYGVMFDQSKLDFLSRNLSETESGRTYAGILPDSKLLEFSQHLTTWPSSRFKDSAIEGLANRISETNPEEALAWATQIHSPSQRLDVVRSVHARYALFDRDKARNAVELSALSDAEKDTLLGK